MDEHRKNQAWFYGFPALALTGPLGISVAAVSHGARSFGTFLTGANPPPFTLGEIAAAFLIAVLPVAGITLLHYIQLEFKGRTDFTPDSLKKNPTSRSKEKLAAMSSPIPNEYISEKPDGWTIGMIGTKYFRLPNDKRNIEHFLINGSPGSAKTQTILTHLVWNFNFAPESERTVVFCNDIKPEIMQHSVIYNNSSACMVRCINPASCSDYYAGWDIYHGLSEDSTDDEIEERVDLISRSLIPSPGDASGSGSSESQVFYDTARNCLVAELLYGFVTGKGFIDSMLQIMSVPLQDMIAEILSNEALCKKHPKLRMYLQSYASDSDNGDTMIRDSENTMRQNLRIFSQRSVQHFFQDASRMTSPEDLLNGISIFLQLPDNLLDQYRTLINLVWSDVLKSLMAVPDYQRNQNSQIIELIIDEFGSCGYLPISEFTARSRSRLYRAVLVSQGLSQLDQTYTPAGRRTIVQNCECKIVLGSSDEVANESFSKMAGNYRETMISNGRNAISQINGIAQNASDQYRPIYDPSDFAGLRNEEKLICFTNGGHYYIDKCPLFMISELKKRSDEISLLNEQFMKKEGVL